MKRSLITKMARIPLAAIACAMLVQIVAAFPAVRQHQPVCKAVDNWIEAHASSLPSSASELWQYPTEYRRRIFSHLSEDAKRQLWIERIEAVSLHSASHWNSEQRDVVKQVKDAVVAGRMFSDPNERERLAGIVGRSLGRDETVELITLEGRAAVAVTPAAFAVRVSSLSRTIATHVDRVVQWVSPTLSADDCMCNSNTYCAFMVAGSTCCPWCAYNPGCTVTTSGCGWIGLDSCGGSCTDNQFCNHPEGCS
jgi:hypothetical protein